jgi:hypothetical protein
MSGDSVQSSPNTIAKCPLITNRLHKLATPEISQPASSLPCSQKAVATAASASISRTSSCVDVSKAVGSSQTTDWNLRLRNRPRRELTSTRLWLPVRRRNATLPTALPTFSHYDTRSDSCHAISAAIRCSAFHVLAKAPTHFPTTSRQPSREHGGAWSASCPGNFTHCKRAPVATWTGGWVGEEEILDPTGTRTATRRSSSP